MSASNYFGFDNVDGNSNLDKLNSITKLFLGFADTTNRGKGNDYTSTWGFYTYLKDAFSDYKLYFIDYSIDIDPKTLDSKIDSLVNIITNTSNGFDGYDRSTAQSYLKVFDDDIDFFFNNTDELLGQKDKNGNWAIYSYIDNVNDGVDYYILDLHRSFFSLISEHFINLLKEFLNSSIIQDNATESSISDQKINDNDSSVDGFNTDAFNDLLIDQNKKMFGDILNNSDEKNNIDVNLDTNSNNKSPAVYSLKLNGGASRNSKVNKMFNVLYKAGFYNIKDKTNFKSFFIENQPIGTLQWKGDNKSDVYMFIKHLAKLNENNPTLFKNFPPFIWNFTQNYFKDKDGNFVSARYKGSKKTNNDSILKEAVDFLK